MAATSPVAATLTNCLEALNMAATLSNFPKTLNMAATSPVAADDAVDGDGGHETATQEMTTKQQRTDDDAADR